MKQTKKSLSIIIAILLFAFIGLTSFTLAAPKSSNHTLALNNITQSKFKLPTSLMLYSLFHKIDVYYNGETFFTNFDVATLKNKSFRTYYVSPNGSTTNSGLAKNKPLNSVANAYEKCGTGDTIVLLDGIYRNENWLEEDQSIKKSINIIGEENVIITQSDNLEFSAVDGFPNIWKANCSTVWQAIDLESMKQLSEVASIEECNSDVGSYYFDSSNVYIHTFTNSQATNKNIVVNSQQTQSPIYINNLVENAKVYLENLNIMGGYNGNLCAYATSNFYPSVYAKNCKFLFSKTELDETFSACTMRGTDSIFQNCEASYSNNDGFNYHKYSDSICVAIEINCVAKDNGLGWKIANCNGSSIHDGGKILRINGHYFGNYGGNVVDVGHDTISVNLGCFAHDSACKESSGFSSDFGIQSSGPEMYLYNCKTQGSYYSIYCTSYSTIYTKDCIIKSKVISTPENFGLIIEI